MAQLSDLAQKVFLDRYALKNKEGERIESTPEEMWKRVARGIAGQEKKKDQAKWEKEFYRVIEDFKFVPAGRILSGAGTEYQVTYFNCFVIPSPKDSRHGILKALGQLVEIQARAGGVGLNLSSLRPRGARVKKVNGQSSGPINWAELFSVATHDIVQQGGSRRGATMLMLWDWHPDVEEFITVKQDLTKIAGANLSVCVSDDFMKAVKEDGDWQLIYPDLDDPEYDEKWDGDIHAWKALGKEVKVYKTVKAKYLWDLICEAAWRSAEPGLHFLERSNTRSNTHYFEKLISTNPCLTGDTLVATPRGWQRVDQIKEGDEITTVLGEGNVARVETYEDRPVFKVGFSDGTELKATAAHQFHAIKRKDRAKKSANKRFKELCLAELEVGDMVRVSRAAMPNNPVAGLPKGWSEKDYGFFMGILLGDGCITEKSLSRNVVKVAVNTSETEWTSIVRSTLQKTSPTMVSLDAGQGYSANLTMQSSSGAAQMVKQSLLTPAYSYEKKIPLEYQNTNREFLAGLLDGLFSTDGNLDLSSTHPFIRLKTTSKQLAQDVRRILLSFGIHGRIATIKKVAPGKVNGRVITSKRWQYEVIISGAGIKIFADQIGLSHPDKKARLKTAQKEFSLTGNTWLAKITSIEPDSKQKVYDLFEPESDTWITEGIVSRGCGEQPLGAWAVCNLGAMNLAAYVKGEEFDYESFGEDVKVAMRFLDNVIDDTYYFYKQNEKCAKDIRRTGLGIMGLGDALIKMKLRYGAEESIPVIDKMFKVLRDNAYEASSDLAKEKGSFPMYDRDKYQEGYHIKNLPKRLREKIAKQGIRNAVLLTVAPTGTTSIIAGVTSGIEPVYEFEFLQRWRGGEQVVYHPLYKIWKEQNPDAQRPPYFVSANDLTPEDHVHVQAIAQKYIDSSISKTVNAPKTHTVEDVQKLYMMAYDEGLKGVTYMRDGSRQGVLERIEEKKEEEPKREIKPIAKRPDIVYGFTRKIMTPLGDTFITVNSDMEGNPFEIFINAGKSGSDVMAMAEALGRMMSMVMRLHGAVDPQEKINMIANQLAGIGGSRSVGFGPNKVKSLPDAVARVLIEQFSAKAANGNGTAYANGHTNGIYVADAERSRSTNGVSHEAIKADAPKEEIINPQSHVMVAQAPAQKASFDMCPECGSASLVHEEGCKKCYSCGYSEC